MKLPDGTIVPSTHKAYRPSELSLDKVRFDNYALRVGTVVERYAPGSPQNFNKKKTEYKVICKHADSNGMVTSTPYICTLSSPIAGSMLDRVNYGLRAGAISYDENGKPLSSGSTVLVLCPNGHSSQSYIVGGLSHPQGQEGYGLDDGRTIFYDFEYNGIAVNINSKGELLVEQRGPVVSSGNAYNVQDITNPDGNNAFVQLNKNGTIKVGTDDQGIVLDRNNKLILIESGGIVVNHSGPQEQWLKSNTYRQAESFMHANMQIELAAIAASLSAAAAALTAASIAIIPPIVGGMLASPSIAAAATAIAAAVPMVQGIQSDLATFEQQAETYLSTKHSFSDNDPDAETVAEDNFGSNEN